MLTPQEVSERVFPKASFGGYHMAQVDEFLDLLTEDYTALYSENAVLKSKMKVLVDKVEEYRATEDAMRKALLTAKNMADEMVREAERKKNEMLAAAEDTAQTRMEEIRRGLADEEARLEAARNATAQCIARAKELYQRELENLDKLSVLTVTPDASDDAAADLVAAAMAEIEANLSRSMEEEEEPPLPDEEDTISFEPVTVPAEEAERDEPEGEEPSGRIDLSDLQFGRNFEFE